VDPITRVHADTLFFTKALMGASGWPCVGGGAGDWWLGEEEEQKQKEEQDGENGSKVVVGRVLEQINL